MFIIQSWQVSMCPADLVSSMLVSCLLVLVLHQIVHHLSMKIWPKNQYILGLCKN